MAKDTFIPVPLLGVAAPANKGAINWSYEKLACLANGVDVFVINSDTLEVVQILSGHLSPVNFVLWLPSGRQFVSAESKLSNRDIVSVDTSNQLIVWDSLEGKAVGNFIHSETHRQILDVQIPTGCDLWVRTKVYILYTGNMLTIFDHAHGTYQNISIVNPPLDTLGTPDQFLKFSTDPHHPNKFSNCLAFLAWDAANSNFSVSHCNYWDYQKDTRIVIQKRIILDEKSANSTFGSNSPSASSGQGNTSGRNTNSSPSSQSLEKRQMPSSTSIRKLVSDIIVGPDYNNASVLMHSQQQRHSATLSFHPGIKDTLVVSTDMNVYFFNVHFMIALHTFSVDKLGAPLVQTVPTKFGPCIFTLHENGTIVLRKYSIIANQVHDMGFQLENVCCNENPRFSGKKTEVLGIVAHPYEENSVIMYLNDGRLLKYELKCLNSTGGAVDMKKHLTTPSTPQVKSFGQMLEDDHSTKMQTSPVKVKHSTSSLGNIVNSILDTTEQQHQSVVTMQLQRITHSFGQFSCIKSQGDLLVVGTTVGFVIVIRVIEGRLKAVKKFTIHASSPVSGIEFVSDNEILTYSNVSFSTNPKCELVLTEIWTGTSKSLKSDENFHIQTIKVSPLGQYFVVIFKNGSGPSELWDLPRRQLIKTLPNKLPPITCIHWREPNENTKEELFYMTDLGTFLFTFRVEGNRFLNATCVKLEHTAHISGIPTALFSRSAMVYRADSNAVVVMYNTVKKTASPSVSIGRGPLLALVKVPGGGNDDHYVAQFADGLVLWEFTGVKKVKTLHNGKLKTTAIAVLNDWVAYISKGSNAIRLLPLDLLNDNPSSPSGNTISRNNFNFGYYLDASEKAARMLTICENNESTILDLIRLSKEFGSREEFTFWNIFHAKWSKHQFADVDIFCDKQKYKDILVKTAQSVWAADYRKREEVAKILLWTGESERAAEILLDTEPSDSATYILNGLKASAAVGSGNLPEQSKAVMKIIATNLIACGDMDGGLELLCLLQKHNEACKYVESTNEWAKAILLCKTALSDKNAEDSLCKYAQFLNSKKCAYKAASIYVFYGKFDRAIEVLFGARLRHLSYLLLDACRKQNIELKISDHIHTAISLDFARFVFECGLQKEAIRFCDSLGDKGNDLKQELEILSS